MLAIKSFLILIHIVAEFVAAIIVRVCYVHRTKLHQGQMYI